MNVKRQAGMTLIELVIVIIVLGIISAIAAPRFVDLQTNAAAASQAATTGSMMSAYVVAVADQLGTPTWTQYIAKIDNMTCGATTGICDSIDYDGEGTNDLQFKFYQDPAPGTPSTCLLAEIITAGINIPGAYKVSAVNGTVADGAAGCISLY